MITKREKKVGRPKGSKGLKTSKEDALRNIFVESFRAFIEKDYPVVLWNFYSIKKNELPLGEIDNVRDKNIFSYGMFEGAALMQSFLFSFFIQPHLKNIKLAPYVEAYVKQEISSNTKPPKYIPSSVFRKAKFKFKVEKFGKITERERNAVLNKVNDGKTFAQISKDTGIQLEKVEEIVNRAIRQKRHISTPFRNVDEKKEKVLVFFAEKSYKNRDAY